MLAVIVDRHTPATYETLRGSSFTPPAQPTHVVTYGLRANLVNAPWSSEVSISYPAASSAATGPSGVTGPASGGGLTGSGSATSATTVGLVGGGWGASLGSDMQGALGLTRLDTSAGTAVPDIFYAGGTTSDVLISGTCTTCGYSTGGVASINPSAWANSALSYYESDCHGSVIECPSIEVLNEPGGSWFWGSGAMSQTNANAYAQLLQSTYDTFHSVFGSTSPKILASYDGGDGNDACGGSCSQWGSEVWGNTVGIDVNSYVDGVTVHAYGNHACPSYPTDCPAALGNRSDAANAHDHTGKPVYVTEFGWPTDCSSGCPTASNETGDSLQWSETQQADNIYNFVTWAQRSGYIASAMYFNYRDYGSNDWYGLERWGEGGSAVDGSKKPGWTALREAAGGQACTVC